MIHGKLGRVVLVSTGVEYEVPCDNCQGVACIGDVYVLVDGTLLNSSSLSCNSCQARLEFDGYGCPEQLRERLSSVARMRLLVPPTVSRAQVMRAARSAFDLDLAHARQVAELAASASLTGLEVELAYLNQHLTTVAGDVAKIVEAPDAASDAGLDAVLLSAGFGRE